MQLTFNGLQSLKDKIQAGNKLHEEQDRLIRGKYWNENPEDFKGCSIGCTLHTMGHDEYSDHAKAAELCGLPEWTMHLSEFLFENTSRPNFNTTFFGAIPVGVSFERMEVVKHKFLLAILSDPTHGTINKCDEAGRAATKTVIALLERAIAGDTPSNEEWAAASAAASAAAEAAAEWAARDAELAVARAAAWAAAWAAKDAARAARAAQYNWMLDTLLELFKTA